MRPLREAVQQTMRLLQQFPSYDVVFRRDPMQPLINAQGDLTHSAGLSSGYAVQGIIWSDEHPLAVIDDELVSAGAVVGPYTILEIHQDGVVVQRDGEKLTIPLDRGLKPPAAPEATAPTP